MGGLVARTIIVCHGSIIKLQPLVRAREVQHHFSLDVDYTKGRNFFVEVWQQNSSGITLILV